jgi:exopolyphosphatase / guanosine-5'-triphosphate,3'-diphosphate pyrophosphatase
VRWLSSETRAAVERGGSELRRRDASMTVNSDARVAFGRMRIAVADLGTNSTRLLIADVGPGGRLAQVERRTEVTRLGEGVDATGRLSRDAIERVYATLARFRELADSAGAERSIAVATSAVRDAENGSELAAHVRDRLGFDIRTVSGDEEARLTFLGATATRATGSIGETLVVDIGGGSTELVVGRAGGGPAFHVSTRLGSVRQTERHLATDPPRHGEMEALAEEADAIVRSAVPEEVRSRVGAGIAVAGTATSLAAIEQELDPYDPEKVDGYRLSLAACERLLAMLALKPTAERRKVAGLNPDRAPTIVAGVAILVESMRVFGLEEVEVSEADILDGAALDNGSPTARGA